MASNSSLAPPHLFIAARLIRRIFLPHLRQQISAPAILPTATGRVTRILSLLLTFYQRVRDRDHLAALDLSARNDLRQDRVDEETRRRFWQT